MTDPHISDEYLISFVKEGDLDKIGILFDRHHKKIYSYFYRLIRNRPESEDLTQNVFLKLINARTTYKHGYQFMPWVFRIAHNVFIDYCNLKKKELTCLNGYSNKADCDPDSEEMEERLRKFYKAFDLLPIDYKELLIMSRYHDLSYKQIGIALGQSERSIKQKAFRAIGKLRNIYNEIDGQGE